MKSRLEKFFIRTLALASVGVIAIGRNGVGARSHVAVLYEDYHQRGSSKVVVFEGCQNIPSDFNDKASSIDSRGDCIRLYENRCCQGRSIELPAKSPLIDDLYNAEFDDVVSSISPCGSYSSPQPPSLLQENWLNHSELLDKVFSDDDVVVYYDNDVSRRIKWPHKYVGDAWRYVKKNYFLDQIAGLTRNEKLHVIFHTGKAYMHYNSSALTYFDVSSECRNIIDITSGDNDTIKWTENKGDPLDIISEQFGNMVIYLYRGGKDAPTFHYLNKGDEDFVKIITFDMYRGLNMSTEQERFFYKALTSKTAGTETERNYVNWFKDWYFPIYQKHGELGVLRKYLKLSAAYYPTVADTRHFNVTESESENGPTLQMNLGEFVHFWSG
ncbi:unnamed protein product [Orchesella dallaii]